MRKNIFSYNVVDLETGNTSSMYGSRFVSKQVSDQQLENVNDGFNIASDIQKRYRLPWYLEFMKLATGVMSFSMVLFFLFQVFDNNTLEQNAIIRFVTFTVTAFAIYLLLRWYEKYQIKQYETQYETSDEKETIEQITKQSFDELDIPTDAIAVELLMSGYKIKNDEHKRVKIGGFYDYANFMFFIYESGDNICFASMEEVYEVPKSAFTDIVKVEKRYSLPTWGKPEGFKSEQYKNYQIRANGFGIVVRSLYEVHIDFQGEEYMVIVPEYDMDLFYQATGLAKNE